MTNVKGLVGWLKCCSACLGNTMFSEEGRGGGRGGRKKKERKK
jgi:hypothetical protein